MSPFAVIKMFETKETIYEMNISFMPSACAGCGYD
jgi:hypothetical protein